MEGTLSFNQTTVTPVDALWSIIQSQSKSVRKALTKRLVEQDVEAETYRQQLIVKQRLTRALHELKEAQATGRELPKARDLLNEL